MIAFALITHKCALAAFCCFFIYIFGTSLRGISHLKSHLPLNPHNGPSDTYHAQVANATTRELQSLLQDPPKLENFAAMGDRIARFSVLADTMTKDPLLERQPLISLLRGYFPWWQPAPATYVPWETQSNAFEAEKGIVICAGSSNLILALHLIRSLRNVLNSTLPIQVAYAGDEDLSFHDRRVFTDQGPDIETLDLLHYFDNGMSGLVGGSWAMKPFAMLASRFKKTIVVDADAIFLRAPDNIFEEAPGLLETGTLFWYDRAYIQGNDRGRHAWVRSIMEGREPSPMLNESLFWTANAYHGMDSAVVCMDKGRSNVFMSLLFACWMNTRKVREQVTYKHVHGQCPSSFSPWQKLKNNTGDKETFWLASELSSSNYSFVPTFASSIGTLTPLHKPPEPLTPFRSPLLNPNPPSSSRSHDSADLKPRLGALREVTHHRILSEHSAHPAPMQICSPQALHLDHLGRLFWFNGSLRKNKANAGSTEMGTFTHVIFGSRNMTQGAQTGWKMGPMPCLRQGRVLDLEREGDLMRVVDGVLGEARKVDMEIMGTNDVTKEKRRMEKEKKNVEMERKRRLLSERRRRLLSGWKATLTGDDANQT